MRGSRDIYFSVDFIRACLLCAFRNDGDLHVVQFYALYLQLVMVIQRSVLAGAYWVARPLFISCVLAFDATHNQPSEGEGTGRQRTQQSLIHI